MPDLADKENLLKLIGEALTFVKFTGFAFLRIGLILSITGCKVNKDDGWEEPLENANDSLFLIKTHVCTNKGSKATTCYRHLTTT